MSDRYEYVKCIRDTHEARKQFSLCGRNLGMEFAFVDISHAYLNRINGGYLVTCSECAKKVVETFTAEIAEIA